MRWTGERVSSLLNLPRETAVEAATANDAVAWGCTLEKLQDRLNRVPDRASPGCSGGSIGGSGEPAKGGNFRFVTSIVAGLNIVKRRQPWRSEQFSPPSLCKEPQRRRFVHGRQQALREGPAIAGGLNRHPSPNRYGKRASCRMLNRTWSEPPRERRSLEGSGYLGTPDGYGGFAWRNKAVAG